MTYTWVHPIFYQLEMWTWWRHQMETFFALLAICAGNSPVSGEFPAQRPVKRSFDVFFDLRMKERLSKQSRGWWFETLLRPLWRHCNENAKAAHKQVLWLMCMLRKQEKHKGTVKDRFITPGYHLQCCKNTRVHCRQTAPSTFLSPGTTFTKMD